MAPKARPLISRTVSFKLLCVVASSVSSLTLLGGCKTRTFHAATKTSPQSGFDATQASNTAKSLLARINAFVFPPGQLKTIALEGRQIEAWGDLSPYTFEPVGSHERWRLQKEPYKNMGPQEAQKAYVVERRVLDTYRSLRSLCWRQANLDAQATASALVGAASNEDAIKAASTRCYERDLAALKANRTQLRREIEAMYDLHMLYRELTDVVLELKREAPTAFESLKAEVLATVPPIGTNSQTALRILEGDGMPAFKEQIVNVSEKDLFLRLLFLDESAWLAYVRHHLENGLKDGRSESYYASIMLEWSSELRGKVAQILEASTRTKNYNDFKKHIDIPEKETYLHKGPKRLFDLFSAYALRADLFFPARINALRASLGEERAAKQALGEWFELNRKSANLQGATTGKGTIRVEDIVSIGEGVRNALHKRNINDVWFAVLGSTGNGKAGATPGGYSDVDGYAYYKPALVTDKNGRATSFELGDRMDNVVRVWELKKSLTTLGPDGKPLGGQLVQDSEGGFVWLGRSRTTRFVTDLEGNSREEEASNLVNPPPGFFEQKNLQDDMTEAIRKVFETRVAQPANYKVPGKYEWGDDELFVSFETLAKSAFVRKQRIGNATQMNPVVFFFRPDGISLVVVPMHDNRSVELDDPAIRPYVYNLHTF